mgnify:FL=1
MTKKLINTNKNIYELCKEYPEIKNILSDLGFEAINNPIMFNTMAKLTTIDKASKIKNIDMNNIIKKFEENGFAFENNERNEILKDLIKRLHNGENIENIKKEFAEKLNKVSAIEIHNAMHELVESKMTIDEAKRFFYMRSLILAEAIDNEEINQNYKDNYIVIEEFKKENLEIEKSIENIIASKDTKLFEEFYNQLNNHYIKKETLFFAGLNKYGNSEPSKVMSKVDKEILEEANEIISINGNKIFDKIEELKNKIKDMIFKEENILIPLVISTFSKEDFEEIKEKYSKI